MRRLAALGAAALASALALSAAPAAAAPGPAPAAAFAELALTVSADSVSPGSSATLTCLPDGGTHPTPVDACDTLASVDGYVERIPPNREWVCPGHLDPVTVTARGLWGNRVVLYEKTFINRCYAVVSSDFVFDLIP
ncbi:SSI family serine proteinase inhibitor [Streptomyces sp. 4N509B]|uniref:SSI family serine proteinase inhibitor n=1 Tax=Streptomyces sp. 4N509B TaxID=3457413 RepID=UPI003FCF2135